MPARDHLSLADQYLTAARDNFEAGLHNPAVSAAVHAVICANNAVCEDLLGEHPRGKSHGEAARWLQRACEGTPFATTSAARARQLSRVLSMKTEAEYSGTMLSANDARTAVEQSQRFVAWARGVVLSTGTGCARPRRNA